MPAPPLPFWPLFFLTYPSVIGSALLVFACIIRWQFAPQDRQRCEWLLVASCVAVPINAACQLLTEKLGIIRRERYDLYLLWFDRLCGTPGFRLGQYAGAHRWFLILLAAVYDALPLALLAILAAYLWRRTNRETVALARTIGLNLVAALPFYLLVPAAGPAFAYPDFPAIPSIRAVAVITAAHMPINCVPSVHFGTALLVVGFARKWRWLFAGTCVYAFLMALATLGTGQHYLVDLIAAVPYAAGIVWLGSLRRVQCQQASYRPLWSAE